VSEVPLYTTIAFFKVLFKVFGDQLTYRGTLLIRNKGYSAHKKIVYMTMSYRGPWRLGNLNLVDYFPPGSQAFYVNS